ncbi:MAG: response regulator [Desulfobacterales bacterium]|nr:response regulator [Desulfobacterales bacterium]
MGESPDQVLKTDETFWAHIHEKDRQKISDLVRQSKKDRSSMAAEFRLVRTDGEVLEVRGAADHYFDDGNLMISRGVLQDITVQKQAQEDLARLEDQLIQAQKMESIGRLAGGVAHDYNNISGIIIGYTELAMDQVNSDDPLHQTLEKVISAAQRATDITRQLLAFARKQTIDPKVIELNQAVKNILNILERLIGEDIDLVWNPGQNIWLVKIDPAQVDQILVNLCINSRDAICGSGKITIETRNVSFDHAYCNQHSGFKPGDYSMLAVSDDGTGMTQEILENVFEPFFTTKEIGQGTGLGLSTIYGIVKQNNGFVNAYSEPGEGTSIKVYLKRYKGTLDYAEKSDENENEKVRATGETILIVEDDKDILDLAKTVLTKAGYRVIASNTPVSALSIAREETGRIHLLLTDVVMPEMSGRELADALPKISPGIETLFMSGYTANIIAHRGVLDKGVNFISKPFSGKELTAKVRKILDKDKKDLVIRQS